MRLLRGLLEGRILERLVTNSGADTPSSFLIKNLGWKNIDELI